MMIMARPGSYGDILEMVRGKKVLIWTCNTCARLCSGIGGGDAAERLGHHLSSDGIEVVGVVSVSASCIEEKVLNTCPDDGYDVILCLACSVAEGLLCGITDNAEVIGVLSTLGNGYLGRDGTPVLVSPDGMEQLPDSASRRGLIVGPYV